MLEDVFDIGSNMEVPVRMKPRASYMQSSNPPIGNVLHVVDMGTLGSYDMPGSGPGPHQLEREIRTTQARNQIYKCYRP